MTGRYRELVRVEPWVRICAVIAASLGATALLGWFIGILWFGNLGWGIIPMAPSTATCVLLSSCTLLLGLHASSHRARRAGLLLSTATALLVSGILTLSFFDIHPALEHLWVTVQDLPGVRPIGHMSKITACGLLLFWASYASSLLASPKRGWLAMMGQSLAGVLTIMSTVLLLGYFYGSPLMSGNTLIAPASTTCLALFALGAGLIGFASLCRAPSRETEEPAQRSARLLGTAFFFLALGVVLAGLLYFRRVEHDYRNEVARQLSAIAELKVADLVRWRKERLGDAETLTGNRHFASLVERALSPSGDPASEDSLRSWLAEIREAYQYERVVLLDAQGTPRLATPDAPQSLANVLARLPKIFESKEAAFVDFYRSAPDGPIRLAAVAPIFADEKNTRPLGAVLLYIDPEVYLYPMITRWPTLSQTAETLLVRREGNEVVFLNRLRFKDDAALNLRLPLNRVEVPAVKAVLGEEGIVEGWDYRDIPVLACLRAIPNSPWCLVARMDQSEVDAPLRQRLWVQIGFIALLLLIVAMLLRFFLRRQTLLHYREQLEAAEALRKQEERYHRTLDDMMEGCQVIDRDWRYLYINPATARYARVTKETLVGRTMMECFPGIEDTPLFAELRRCMEERVCHQMENEFPYRDGSSAWFELNIQPAPEGLFILAIDITQRKRDEARLRHLTDVLRAVRNVNQLITQEKSPEALLRRACELMTEARGYRSAWIARFDPTGTLHAEAESGVGCAFDVVRRQMENGDWPRCCRMALATDGIAVVNNVELTCGSCPVTSNYRDTAAMARGLRHQGRNYGVLTIALPASLADDPEEQSLFIEMTDDIGFALHAIEIDQERRHAERDLSENEALLEEVGHIARIGGWEMDLRTRKARWTETTYAILGFGLNDPIPGPDEHIQYYVEEDRPKVAEAMRALIAEDVPLEFEARLADQGQGIRWFRALGRSVRENGECILVRGTIQDITERKLSEENVKATRMKLEAALSSMNDAVFISDAHGDLIEINDAFATFHRFKDKSECASTLSGYPSILEIRVEDGEPAPPEQWPVPRALRGETAANAVYTLHRKDTGETWIGSYSFAPIRDSSGVITGSVVVARDITDDKRAEAALLESEERFRSLVSTAPDGIFVQQEGRFVFVNPAMVALLGARDAEDLLGADLMEHVAPEYQDAVRARIRAQLETGLPAPPSEQEYLRVDSQRVPVETTAVAIQYGGRNAHLVFVRDIANRRKAEEETRRLNRALRILSACNETLVRTDDEGELLKCVCDIVRDVGGYGLVCVGFAEEDGAKRIRPVASSERVPGYLNLVEATWDDTPLGQGPSGVAIRTGQPVLIRDTWTDLRFAPWREAAMNYGYLSCIALPLQSLGCTFGVMLIFAEHEDAFDADEAKLLLEMAEDLAYGIATLRTRAERLRAEQRLAASEERYRALVESAPDAIIVYRDNSILYANAKAVALCGLGSFDELGDEGILEVIHPDARAATAERMRRSMSGMDLSLWETRILRPDGTEVPVETVGGLVEMDGAPAVQVFVRDITERKKSEEKLRKLSAAVTQSPVVVLITNLNGDIEYVNPRFTEVTGYTWEEVAGKNPRLLKSGETPMEEYAALWTAVSAGGEWRGEFRNKRKDGSLCWERAFIAPIRDASGNITHYIAIEEEISQQKQLEAQYRQAQRMEAIGQLAGGVAHDFNNVLQAIVGYGGMLAEALPEDAAAREFTEEILHAADRASTLTRQLLAFSRRQVLDMEHLDMNDVVQRIMKMIRRVIGEAVEVTTLGAHPLATVHADRGQMEQVILNLSVNARDAMPEGGTLLIETENAELDDDYCTVHPWATPGQYVLLSVTDTGCGMDAETQGRIFEPFFTTKDPGKGTGLGLATVYGIVAQHHGLVNVYSELGRGTTFKIYLPASPKAAEVREAPAQPRPIGGNETILIAEDDALLRKLATQILEAAGYRVLLACDGQEAIEVVQQHPEEIALLVLDVVMPKMGGKGVYDALQQTHPHIKFLFSSGYSTNAIHTNFVLKEGIELLRKPYAPNALLSKVRELLDKRE